MIKCNKVQYDYFKSFLNWIYWRITVLWHIPLQWYQITYTVTKDFGHIAHTYSTHCRYKNLYIHMHFSNCLHMCTWVNIVFDHLTLSYQQVTTGSLQFGETTCCHNHCQTACVVCLNYIRGLISVLEPVFGLGPLAGVKTTGCSTEATTP